MLRKFTRAELAALRSLSDDPVLHELIDEIERRKLVGPGQGLGRKIRPIEERFWRKVVCDLATGCWIWVGSHPNGYGVLTRAGRGTPIALAHRFSWELHVGPIPEALFVCHNCPAGDNPLCVRPDHLFLGTNLENLADMRRKGRGFVPKALRGRTHPLAKLTDAAVAGMRTRYLAGATSQTQLAREYGVSQALVSSAIRGLHWHSEEAGLIH